MRVAVQPMDQLIILDQAIGVEPADLDHRIAAKRGERARDQEQAVDLLPGMPRQEIAATLRKWFDEDAAALKKRNERFESIVRGDET